MKTTISTTALVLFAFLLFSGAKVLRYNDPHPQFQDQVLQYPENIRTIIDNKCFGCHNPEGGSQDAKDALMWDDLPGLSRGQQVGTLDEIIEVLDEGIMPPEQMVEMNPDAALTDEELQALRSWAEATADELLQ
jgi:hypothetical protein